MEATRFDGWTRRRLGAAGGGVIASLLALAAGDGEARKKKRRKPKHKPRPKPKTGDFCTPAGEPCRRQGKKCAAKFCLEAPFTIEARWSIQADHDTFLFLPPENETTGPSPFIRYNCVLGSSCDTQYPFACTSADEVLSGAETTTIYRRLAGTYEYWIEMSNGSAPGDLTVVLRDQAGRVVREWESPASVGSLQNGWHVFDFDGATGTVKSVDKATSESLPGGAHNPSTKICP